VDAGNPDGGCKQSFDQTCEPGPACHERVSVGADMRDLSETAFWAALCRARESERESPLFRDLLARRLAGPPGGRFASSPDGATMFTPYLAARTWMFDRGILAEVSRGADLVLNLAAGLDSRPYRLPLPSSLRWVEIDLSEVLEWKQRVLADERPACAVERVGLDLLHVDDRRSLFASLEGAAERILIVSEGFFIYLSEDEVGSLARDLAGPPNFQRLLLDLASPRLLRRLQRSVGPRLGGPQVVLRFGPEQGQSFFVPHGWVPARELPGEAGPKDGSRPAGAVSGVYTLARSS
jgi:methyltransferase (TIGR00027 family)